jgi:Transcriptional regulator
MNNTAVKVLKILDYIATAPTASGVSEISRALGYAKSSVFDILSVLRDEKYIEYENEAAKTFKIGIKCYQIGSGYLKNTGLHKAAKPIMERLSRETGETVFLAIEDDGCIVYLDKVTGSSPFVFMCDIGARNLMQVTGIGKAMLAGYPNAELARIVGDKLERRTQNSIVDLSSLISEMNHIRDVGYAVDYGEDNESVRCIGAPIRDHSQKIIAGISVSMLSSVFTEEMKEKTITAVTKAAKEISQKLGYLKEQLYH